MPRYVAVVVVTVMDKKELFRDYDGSECEMAVYRNKVERTLQVAFDEFEIFGCQLKLNTITQLSEL